MKSLAPFNSTYVALVVTSLLMGCQKVEPPAESPSRPPVQSVDPLQRLVSQAQSGDAYAQFDLGMKYANGEGVKKDPAMAMEWIQKAAGGGDARALVHLARLYVAGDGVRRDALYAYLLYRRAALTSSAEAQNELGKMHERGVSPDQGSKPDPLLSLDYWTSSGMSRVEFDRLYEDGVVKDSGTAADWYQKSAAQNHAEGKFNLGRMYARGEGVPKDTARAIGLYEEAAALGSSNAQFSLAVRYDSGQDVEKDPSRALELYKKSAAQGHANAQLYLGSKYIQMQEYVLAYAWFNLVTANRSRTLSQYNAAKRFVEVWEAKLTPEELREAQRLSSNWKIGQDIVRDKPIQ